MKTVKSAREALTRYRSIQADLKETVTIGGRILRVQGRYLQGRDLKLRLELSVTVGNAKDRLEGSLLEVCDGHLLFTRHRIGKEEQFTRRDVRQILKAAETQGVIPHNVLIAELGLGGLPALLASLEKTMEFGSVKKTQIDGKSFSIVEGTWNKSFLDRFRPADSKQPLQLPSYVPDRVRLYLDPNLFPHRILYLKRDPQGDLFRPMLKLDFTNVALNTPVKDEQFHFVPPDGVIPRDITSDYIKRMTPAKPREQGGTGGKPTPQP